jgi:signal transduction histidine kinase
MVTAEGLDHGPPHGGRHLANAIYHDVATSVAAIRLLAKLAASEEGIPGPVQQRLSQIVDETHRIAEILTHVLGRAPKQQAPVHPLLTEVVARSRLVHGNPITADVEPTLVHADPVAMRRLLSNLIDNACRACAPSGPVQVRLHSPDSGTVLEIADSGPGPGAWTEVLNRPYVRSNVGMGLSIVRSIVEECQGTVTVGSDSSLGGSNVVVTFPPAS